MCSTTLMAEPSPYLGRAVVSHKVLQDLQPLRKKGVNAASALHFIIESNKNEFLHQRKDWNYGAGVNQH
jgi:hypothetical protein